MQHQLVMKRSAFAISVFLLGCAHTSPVPQTIRQDRQKNAAAGSLDVAPTPMAGEKPPPDNSRDWKPRSPELALGLSLGSTLFLGGIGTGLLFSDGAPASVPLISIGLLVGPSLGHFYAGRVGRGLLFALGRASAMALGFYGGWSKDNCDATGKSDDRFHCPPAGFLLPVGGVALLFLAAWEIIITPDAAREYNREHAPAPESAVSISPLVLPSARHTPGDSPGLGLLLGWRF